MSTYTLNIAIDANGIGLITAADQQVALVWKNGTLDIVGVLFLPTQNAVVTWTDAFDVFVSNAPLAAEAQVVPNSWRPAVWGHAYRFAASVFTDQGAGAAGAIQLVNGDGALLTAGLSNTVTVNGVPGALAPLVASVVPNGGTATFPPPDQVLLVALSDVVAGTALDADWLPFPSNTAVVSSGGVLLDFSATATLSATYDDASGGFVAG